MPTLTSLMQLAYTGEDVASMEKLMCWTVSTFEWPRLPGEQTVAAALASRRNSYWFSRELHKREAKFIGLSTESEARSEAWRS